MMSRKIKNSYFLLSFLNGISLLVFEILASKFLASYFGSSYHVWSIMLFSTLIGLALAYALSFFLLKRAKNALSFVYLLVLILLILIPFTGPKIIPHLVQLSFIPALFLSSLLFVFPFFLCVGLFTPLIIDKLSKIKEHKQKNDVSIILFLSSIGGVLGIYLFGFTIIPYYGINFSFGTLAVLNFVALVLTYYLDKKHGA